MSYVPLALQHHATLFAQARVVKVLTQGRHARGVVAEARSDATGSRGKRRLTIRSRAVVVSCGTYGTPTLLLRNGLANSSGQLGRNLTIHPAVGVFADFHEPIDGWNAIPQSYSITEFHDERVMCEGGFTPLDIGSASLGFFGPAFTEAMERYNHLACFGFMVEDSSRGRVRLGPRGRPIVLYNVNRADLKVVHRGIGILSEIYFAAGARRVYPPVLGHEQLDGLRDLERFRRARIRAIDVAMSAYHPLGTARMGVNPRQSVVGPDHECHDVDDLYIVDGSSLPSPLGVNPQITIMALATRAAEKLAERLG